MRVFATQVCNGFYGVFKNGPGMSSVVPLTLITGATETLYSAGQPPSVVRVDPSKATSPTPSLDCNPMKARNSPIPAEVESLTGFGMAFAILVRKPSPEMAMKINPSTKTAPRADL